MSQDVLLLYGQHIAEAALVDDLNAGIFAKQTAQLMDITVQGVAVAYVVAAPYGDHKRRGIDGLACVGGQFFQYARFEVRQGSLSGIDRQLLG